MTTLNLALQSMSRARLHRGRYRMRTKMASAPDRTILPGLTARLITGALAGAALGPAKNRMTAATLGAFGAVVGGYAGLALRKQGMRRYGQMRSGLVEDILTLAATALLFRPLLHRTDGSPHP